MRVLFNELASPSLVNNEIRDQQCVYVVKGYLGILNNIIRFHNEAREIFRDRGRRQGPAAVFEVISSIATDGEDQDADAAVVCHQ